MKILTGDKYVDFILKLVVMGKITPYDAEIEKGKYSGYPMCCVKHFAKYMEMGIEWVGCYMDTMYGYDDINYVRCFKCRGKQNAKMS